MTNGNSERLGKASGLSRRLLALLVGLLAMVALIASGAPSAAAQTRVGAQPQNLILAVGVQGVAAPDGVGVHAVPLLRLVSATGVAVERATHGDAHALADIAAVDHGYVQEAAMIIGEPLTVTRAAAVRVLRGLINEALSPTAAQAWASFMRRGYAETSTRGPVRPIDIEFEGAWEDAISAVISRLDEIGDVIDGVLTTGEALDLLQLLGEQ